MALPLPATRDDDDDEQGWTTVSRGRGGAKAPSNGAPLRAALGARNGAAARASGASAVGLPPAQEQEQQTPLACAVSADAGLVGARSAASERSFAAALASHGPAWPPPDGAALSPARALLVPQWGAPAASLRSGQQREEGPRAVAALRVPAARCLACSFAGRCASHRRAAVPALSPRRIIAAPVAASCGESPNGDDEENCAPLDAETRARVLALAAKQRHARRALDPASCDDEGSSSCSSSSSSDEGGSLLTQQLSTDWSAHPHNVRLRERALRLAGFSPKRGAVGEHPQWVRLLPSGRAQRLGVAGSPSDCRHWNNQTAQLRKLDRAARGDD